LVGEFERLPVGLRRAKVQADIVLSKLDGLNPVPGVDEFLDSVRELDPATFVRFGKQGAFSRNFCKIH